MINFINHINMIYIYTIIERMEQVKNILLNSPLKYVECGDAYIPFNVQSYVVNKHYNDDYPNVLRQAEEIFGFKSDYEHLVKCIIDPSPDALDVESVTIEKKLFYLRRAKIMDMFFDLYDGFMLGNVEKETAFNTSMCVVCKVYNIGMNDDIEVEEYQNMMN
jgi:hypothetical protein